MKQDNTEEFEWDTFNRDKNLVKHGVYWQECEQAFFDTDKKVFHDTLHSGTERRYILLGKTFGGRLLFKD